MRLALVTDAWTPQVNGVVNCLGRVVDILRRWGDDVTVVAPDRFRTFPCPTYPEIRLALAPPRRIADLIEESRAEFLHIATEGPLGMLARRYAVSRSRGFTTAYHNCGDWVESCTALVEHHEGEFEIIRWTEPSSRRPVGVLRPEREAAVA